ncbi:MAG: 4Fe-4S dicluster domain-containing protein [Candidatus Coatesbacteria bacterium]|nr:MAG: 4Fe-4S dicluster domain-containing protein [Candidatus Coatesbacteria bacterium]
MDAEYYKLSAENAAGLFERARADYDVVAKTRDANGNLVYGRPVSFEDVAFVDEQPPMSAKAFALPQNETLVRYERGGGEIRAETPEAPARDLLLFGVNVCDAAAFDIIDRVFQWDYLDDPYLARRERTTQLALACTALQRDCFCNRISYAEDGVDAVAYPREGHYLVKIQTDNGRRLVERYRNLFAEADGDPETEITSFLEKAGTAKREPLLETAQSGLAGAFEHADWEILASTCIGCGICTYTCPTCHCFDIQDEGGYVGGRRLRTWDHCTGRTFTAMPAHQPRDRQYKRYRQRLLHKFWYYPERFGPVLCTGCGRCITHCPVKINIKELVEYFGGLSDAPPGGRRHAP